MTFEGAWSLYWGSHSYHDPAAVTTFGDHYSLPRSGLPDVLWRLGVEAPEPVRSRVTHAAEGLVRRHAAALMLALRDGPKSASQLAAITGFGREDVQDVLDLLVALDYVTESGGTYGAVIPVLIAGLFADPYDSGRRFPGFIPAVYRLDVVQGPL